MLHSIKASVAALCAGAGTETVTLATPFSAHPLFCASCLRIALWRGETDLALRCASTLSVFDPKLLWKTLTVSALEDHCAEAETLLPLALAAPLASKKLGQVWPVAALLVQRIALAPKSRFYLLAARLLTHKFYAPKDDSESCGFGDVPPARWSAAERVFTNYWAPRLSELWGKHSSLSWEFERLSALVTWERLDLAEAAWRATASPSALAFAALECGVGSVDDPADCSTTEVALSHQTSRGRLWLRSLAIVPPQISDLSESLRTDVYGEALERIETERHVGQVDIPDDGQLQSLGGLSLSKARGMARHIRANLPYIRESRRTYLDTLKSRMAAHTRSSEHRCT